MDLNQINVTAGAETGAFMELEHPVSGDVLMDEKGKPMGIELIGTDSAEYRNKQREIQSRRMTKLMKGKGSPILSDAETCELLASATRGWSGIVENGKDIKFSKQAAVELFTKHVWIREQVDAFIADRGNFLKV